MAAEDISLKGTLNPASSRANVIIPVVDGNLTQDTENLGSRQKKLTADLIALQTDLTAAKDELKGGVATEGDNLAKLYALIQTLNSIVGGTTPDGNSVTDTVAEILAIFSTYPEGVDIASTLAGKINTSAIVNTLTETVTGKVLDATQGKALKDLIDALTTTVSGNTSAIAGKADASATVVAINSNYTLTASDNLKVFELTGTITITILDSLPIGFSCSFFCADSLVKTFNATTFKSPGSVNTMSTQDGSVSIVKITNTVTRGAGALV